jgi:hypothetical protein
VSERYRAASSRLLPFGALIYWIDGDPEAMSALRDLIDAVIVHPPSPNGKVTLDVQGHLASLLGAPNANSHSAPPTIFSAGADRGGVHGSGGRT